MDTSSRQIQDPLDRVLSDGLMEPLVVDFEVDFEVRQCCPVQDLVQAFGFKIKSLTLLGARGMEILVVEMGVDNGNGVVEARKQVGIGLDRILKFLGRWSRGDGDEEQVDSPDLIKSTNDLVDIGFVIAGCGVQTRRVDQVEFDFLDQLKNVFLPLQILAHVESIAVVVPIRHFYKFIVVDGVSVAIGDIELWKIGGDGGVDELYENGDRRLWSWC